MIINKFNPNVDIFTEEGILHLDNEGKGKGPEKVEKIVANLKGYSLIKEEKPKAVTKEPSKTTKETEKPAKRATRKRTTSAKKEE